MSLGVCGMRQGWLVIGHSGWHMGTAKRLKARDEGMHLGELQRVLIKTVE